MIRNMFIEIDTHKVSLPSQEELSSINLKKGTLWVDITDESVEDSLKWIEAIANFHQMPFDSLFHYNAPRVNDWDSVTSIVLHSHISESASRRFKRVGQISLLMGEHFLITIHKRENQYVSELWEKLQGMKTQYLFQPGYIVFKIGEAIAQNLYLDLLQIEASIDEIDEHIFETNEITKSEKFYKIKQKIVAYRRILAPQNEVFLKLWKSGSDLSNKQDRHHFRDLFDQYAHYYQLNESMNELLNDAMNLNFAKINTNLNRIVKTLTIFNALFLPLTFITSFFGMNFFGKTPELDSSLAFNSFVSVLGFTILFFLILVLVMRQRKWFN